MKTHLLPGQIAKRLTVASPRGWQSFESTCDRVELRNLARREAVLDDELSEYETWSEAWWKCLRRSDLVRTERILKEGLAPSGGAP